MKTVVLVTGSSTGLGASIAIQAAQAGYTVYASMRDIGKQERLAQAAEAAGVALNIVPLDVRDTVSVNAAVDNILQQHGQIDGLIANAGVGYVRTTEQATEADIGWVMDTNFMGVVRCVKAVLPQMRERRTGRVIAISSVGGLVGQPFNEIYCASKFAIEGYIESLASYVGPAFGVHFTSVEPGGIASEFAASALQQFQRSGGMIEDDYLPLLQKYIGGRETRTADGVVQTPDAVAKVVMDCLAADHPPVRVRTSPWSEQFACLKTQGDPDGTLLPKAVYDNMIGTD